ncbi:hypothetical protein WA026_021420 [Henosepilachna vigintioctopunctata]|uniref:RRM domain-containing protein n=1 Tax=Henosepilachna vigintioctopunctata TaxID=420089 RepID=A0AAW1TXV4_9CUCU
MARFGKRKRPTQSRKKALYVNMKGRRNARRKYLLPKKGLNQSTYESGFFDFLDVFWNNSRGMNIYNLTRQVAKVWDDLLPRPKLNKNTVLRDYYEEYKALQEKEKKRKEASQVVNQAAAGNEEERNRDIMKRQENVKRGSDSGTEGESRTDFDEDTETDARSSRSRSDVESRTDEGEDSMSETSGRSEADDLSRSESEPEPRRRQRKPRRRERKYESYEAYLRTKNAQSNMLKGTDQKSNNNTKVAEKQQSPSHQNKDANETNNKGAQEGVFFPVRPENSFDRIVQGDLENQTKLLEKLKICKPCSDPPYDQKVLIREDMKLVESDDSLEIHSHLPPPPQDRVSSKFMVPTNTLHVKNLIQGVQLHDLEEIFAIFLNDIVMFHILDTKYRGEAVVECKTVEAAGSIWKQLNGVPYKKLPLILEFANKEDLVE